MRKSSKIAPRIAPKIFTLFNSLIPARCPLCAVRTGGEFCIDCRRLLPWIITGCEICGTELYEVGVCGGCQARLPYYDHAVIPFQYRAPVSRHIQSLKYHQQLRYAGCLAAIICRRVWKDSGALPSIIIPIPLHPRRLRMRGFNQASEIAHGIGKELGVMVGHSQLVRVKDTVPQVGLRGDARRRNVRNAFQAIAPIQHAHIALVDDVVTSGSTVNAAARALKRAGATTVSVWAAAKT